MPSGYAARLDRLRHWLQCRLGRHTFPEEWTAVKVARPGEWYARECPECGRLQYAEEIESPGWHGGRAFHLYDETHPLAPNWASVRESWPDADDADDSTDASAGGSA